MGARNKDIVNEGIGSVAATLPPVLLGIEFNSVAIDSRAVQPGDLFVALAGEHTDGHRFVGDALQRGASAALVQHEWATTAGRDLNPSVYIATGNDVPTPLPTPVIIPVADPLQTIQALAARHRARFDLPIIGITGSIGKTSTKELVASVLSQHLRTLSNVKSFNNEIGLPLTLLRLRPEHEVAVLEMGTYGPGEIAALCALARPRYGIVTNVGVSHLERMKTRETVARAKAELVEALPADGAAILNGDDPRVRAMRERTPARTILYGLDAAYDIWADEIVTHGLNGLSFTVHIGDTQPHLSLPLLGRHNVYTALAAIAIARELDVPWSAIEAGLSAPRTQPRLIVRPGLNGATLLDDSYNASPVSCQAALDVLAEMPGRHIAVFGDMAELGPEDEEGHRTVGKAAAGVVDLLLVVGTKARWIGEAATSQQPGLEVLVADTNAAAVALLADRIGAKDYVLVKGARVAVTEEIVAGLAREGSA